MLEFNPLVQLLVTREDYYGLILIPKNIYYEWSRYLISETDYFNKQEEEFFLLPPFNSMEKTKEFCELFFDLFFQYKLRKCIKDPGFWPVNRTYEMFLQWFDVKIISNVSFLGVQNSKSLLPGNL